MFKWLLCGEHGSYSSTTQKEVAEEAGSCRSLGDKLAETTKLVTGVNIIVSMQGSPQTWRSMARMEGCNGDL